MFKSSSDYLAQPRGGSNGEDGLQECRPIHRDVSDGRSSGLADDPPHDPEGRAGGPRSDQLPDSRVPVPRPAAVLRGIQGPLLSVRRLPCRPDGVQRGTVEVRGSERHDSISHEQTPSRGVPPRPREVRGEGKSGPRTDEEMNEADTVAFRSPRTTDL